MLNKEKTRDEVFKQTSIKDIFEMARNYKTRYYFHYFEDLLSEHDEQKEFIRVKSADQVKSFLETLKTRVNNLENLANNPSGCRLSRLELDITREWIAKLQIGIFKILQMNIDIRVPSEYSSSVEEVFYLLHREMK